MVISVLTSPRKGASYVRATLDSVDDNGGLMHVRRLHTDGPLDDNVREWASNGGWHIDASAELGGTLATWMCIRWAVGHDLLFCEDDVALAPQAVRSIALETVPERAALTAYYSPLTLDRPGFALFDARVTRWYGTACFKLPARTVQYLSKLDPTDPRWCDRWPGQRTIQDVVISEMIAASPWPHFAVRVPSLAQHMGDVSSIEAGSGARGKSPTFGT